MPVASARAGKLLSFDENGLPVAVAAASDSANQLALDLASSAAGKGAAMVRFKQAGAGAVDCESLSKMREVVSVKDFGAVGDGTTSGGTVNTAAFNACADYCRSTGKAMHIPDGVFRTGKVDRTGVTIVGAGSGNTFIYGQPGEDVFYWKGSGESGAVRMNNHQTAGMTVYVNTSIDVRANFNRVSMGGHRVGNCGFFNGGGSSSGAIALYPVFDDVWVTANGSLTLNGACALFNSEPINGLELPSFKTNGLSFGIIDGVSDKYYNNKWYVQAIEYNASTDTFTKTSHGYTTGTQLALIYDTNVGAFDTLKPRTKYYVVNATTDTFQLSLTSGGAAIAFDVYSGTPDVYAVRAGSSCIEYASDVRSFGTITAKGTEVSMCLCNGGVNYIGRVEMQSSRVSALFLGFPSLSATNGVATQFGHLYVEGPLDSTWGTGKEYWRFDWSECEVFWGLALRGYTGTHSATISGSDNKLPKIALHPSKMLYLSGNRNDLTLDSGTKEAQIVDTGGGNSVKTTFNGGGGDVSRLRNSLSKYSPSREIGGWWPDYMAQNPAARHRGAGAMLYIATETKYQTPPADLQYLYDDASLDINGYVRSPSGIGLQIRSAFGSSIYPIRINEHIPKSRFRVCFKLRAATAGTTMTLVAQKLSGTTFVGGTKNITLTDTWGVYYVDADGTTATDDVTAQFALNSPSGSYDFAYAYVVPWTDEVLCTRINWGGNIVDIVGTGSPEGVVTAVVGSTFRRIDGGGLADFYYKKSGSGSTGGNTGWVSLTA